MEEREGGLEYISVSKERKGGRERRKGGRERRRGGREERR